MTVGDPLLAKQGREGEQMAKRDEVRRVAGRRYWREGEAGLVVAAWRRSGESLAAFARRHGIAGQRLKRWARRLGEPRMGVRFHRVRLVERGVTQALQRTSAPIEIEWTPGRRVRVLPGFSAEDLTRVLEVLEARERC